MPQGQADLLQHKGTSQQPQVVYQMHLQSPRKAMGMSFFILLTVFPI